MKKPLVFLMSFLFLFASFPLLFGPKCMAETNHPLNHLVLPLKHAPEGKVVFENGHFSPTTSQDKTTRFRAVIDRLVISSWKGNKVAALVLSYETGGSGTFKRLYYLAQKDGTWDPTSWIDLGERTQLRYLSLYRHGYIYVGLIRHKKGDPMCCPTQKVLRIFSVTPKGIKPAGTFKVALFPDEVRCDLSLISPSAKLELLPEVSFSPHSIGPSVAIPAHVGLVVDNKRIIMRVIDKKAYVDMWFKEHDPTINIAVRRLERALKRDTQSLSPPFDILPPRPGINDFAIFVSKIPFKNGLGIGFIGRIAEDLVCIDNGQLKFFYMGLDETKRFLVTMSKPVRVSQAVPGEIWMCKQDISGLKKQMEQIKKTLLEIGEEKAFPGLGKIRAFIKTLEIVPK